MRFFVLDISATSTTHLTGLTRKSVTMVFLKSGRRIAEECERASPLSSGEVEVDESYFGACRVRGKRGRGASGKTPVFGLLKRDGCAYAEIVSNCKEATLQAIIRGRASIEVIIHSDGWRGYDGLVDVGYSKHYRVNHGRNEFARGARHIDGIESFWRFAQHRLQEFHGIAAHTFYLRLKECEYGCNNRNGTLQAELLKLLTKHPL